MSIGGTLDTKGDEHRYVRHLIDADGVSTTYQMETNRLSNEGELEG